MPKFAVTVSDNGVRKRVVLESDVQPTEADVLSALRGSSGQTSASTSIPQMEAAAVVGSTAQLNQAVQKSATIGEMRRREERGLVFALSPEQIKQATMSDAARMGQAMQQEEARLAAAGAPSAFDETVPEGAIAASLPIAAGFATGGLGVIPAAAYTAFAGGAGETAEQAKQILEGKRERIEPGKILKSAAIAGTPALRPIQGTAGPLAAGILQGSAQAGVNALTAAFGETLQKYIDQGRLPTIEEIGKEISIPAIFGAATGGATGALGRAPRTQTTEEQIAQQGRQAGQRLEETLGAGTAPLTATQQTGRNVPGTFGPGSSGLAAQQALPERIRGQLGIPAQQERATAQVAQQEVLGAEAASRQALRGSAAGAGGQAVGEVEGVIGTILPRSPRAASLQDAANNSVGFIRGEDQRLSGIVDDAYNTARTARTTRLGGQAETPVTPSQNLQDTIDDVLGTLATEERVTVTPSPIIGGTPTTTVERIPSQFFNEASSRARALLDVARSPQTFEQIVGLRQSIDGVINQFQEFAPGVAQNQLRRLRTALKQEELASARRLGIENEVVAAQRAAENRFNLLQDNQIIRRASIPAAEGGYQNTEQFFSDLASSPAGFESVRNLLTTTPQGRIQFDQIRRGFVFRFC